ncbi:MAG TPA: aminoglycoside phosphotransferase family protein [Bryobacteraceae bacterium]|nr:aminoglycoside phosphotransferase family protein [Bryobacteraceae bacterium]
MSVPAETGVLTQSLRKIGLIRADEVPRYEALPGGVSSEIWRVDLRGGSVCVKRALPKLRVEKDWFAPIERNRYEVAWMKVVASILPGTVPRIVGHDVDQNLFAMEYLSAESHPLWKLELRDGRADSGFAFKVGEVLGRIHAATANNPDVAALFPTDFNFRSIRMEPYLESTARVHTDLAPALLDLVKMTMASKYVLVHGDVSPKNILVGPTGPVFLDAECAWYGDPAFDLAFCLNHLLLKCLWTPSASRGFLRCFETMREAYMNEVIWEPSEQLEARASALLPGLFLARADGKSPVEYLTEEDKSRVRRVGRFLLRERPERLETIRRTWAEELGIV